MQLVVAKALDVEMAVMCRSFTKPLHSYTPSDIAAFDFSVLSGIISQQAPTLSGILRQLAKAKESEAEEEEQEGSHT